MQTQPTDTLLETASACPVDHSQLSTQKTARVVGVSDGPPIERDASGVWHVRSYRIARDILRSDTTRQAGFNAELLASMPSKMTRPILYLEGKQHHQQRKISARFFTPKAVSDNYRRLMETFTTELIDRVRRAAQIDLSQISMALAVRVAAEVVGLTNSILPGMDRRLNAFFENDIRRPKLRDPRTWLAPWQQQSRLWSFFLLDVKPAIRARRQQPREDVISHLISQGYTDMEILTECVTYAAAGMVTTREFICVAAWHMLEHPALMNRYLVAGEEERYAILHETLRLEPVVARLQRRMTADMTIETGDGPVMIPAGDLVKLGIYEANSDEALVGDDPEALCPARPLSDPKAGPMVLSFGDGAHRCPGAYIAIQESDIFLRKLLALPSLRIVREPTVTWHELTTGYEIRDFIIAAR